MDASGDGRTGPDPGDLDSTVVALAELMSRRRNGRWVACAETFTAGLLSRAMGAVDDAGEWFAGGVVVPDAARRRRVLGVRAPDEVSEGCAVQMALGALQLFGSAAAVAVTGVHGAHPVGAASPGTVVVGWVVDGQFGATTLTLPGTDKELALRAVRSALTSLSRALSEADDGGGRRADAPG
jgi:nicotinamide-nucleotide amidase